MNIFVLDTDPKVAARSLCDKHVVKMILETAQLLSDVHVSHTPSGMPIDTLLYKLPNPMHPVSIWVSKSKSNYEWAYKHFLELCSEYTYRYGNRSKSEMLKHLLHKAPTSMLDVGLTPFCLCMPDEFKVTGDAVSSYRAYYLGKKMKFAKWTRRSPPDWTKHNVVQYPALLQKRLLNPTPLNLPVRVPFNHLYRDETADLKKGFR